MSHGNTIDIIQSKHQNRASQKSKKFISKKNVTRKSLLDYTNDTEKNLKSNEN